MMGGVSIISDTQKRVRREPFLPIDKGYIILFSYSWNILTEIVNTPTAKARWLPIL